MPEYRSYQKFEKIVELLKAQLKLRRRDYLHMRLGDAYRLGGRKQSYFNRVI